LRLYLLGQSGSGPLYSCLISNLQLLVLLGCIGAAPSSSAGTAGLPTRWMPGSESRSRVLAPDDGAIVDAGLVELWRPEAQGDMRGSRLDGRVSFLSSGGEWPALDDRGGAKAAPLRFALFLFQEKPTGLDATLREVGMSWRRPLSACRKETPHVHVHDTAPQRRPRAIPAILGSSLLRPSRPRGCRYHAALADVLRLRRLIPASACFRARSLAVRCLQMTTKLVESMRPAEPKARVSIPSGDEAS